MPKAQRSLRSQGYYRLSPVTTAASLQAQASTSNISAGTPQQYAPSSATTALLQAQTQNLQNQVQSSYYSSQPLTTTMSQQSYHSQHGQLPSSSYPSSSIGGPVLPPQHISHHHQSHSLHHQQPSYTMSSLPAPTNISLRPSSGAWTPTDDSTLMSARASGLNWAPIQQTYFPTKTPNACRKRHERLMERRNADDWDGLKLEALAKGYMQMRREIWTPLAEVTGEKWSVVEQKCMAQGLKNLQTSARSAARRERLLDPSQQSASQPHSLSHSPMPNPYSSNNGAFDHHTDDSGYADDLEAEYDGASDRSSNGGMNGSYQQGHYHSLSNGSAGSYQSAGSNGMNDPRNQYAVNGRLPSMDMGIDAIINRPSGTR